MANRRLISRFYRVTALAALTVGLHAATTISFNAPKAFPAFTDTGGAAHLMVAADFNRDGKEDVVTILTPSLAVLLGNGNGTLQLPVVTTPNLLFYSYAAVAADFNGDGKLDIAISGQDTSGTNGVQILVGKGDGTFILLPTVFGTLGAVLVTGDFNHDGKADLAVSCAVGPALCDTVQILIGRGNGTFQPPISYTLPGIPSGLAVADFNGDGIQDIAATANCFNTNPSCTANYAMILSGNGDGTFQPPSTFSVPDPFCVAAADFNLDGKQDLAVCSGNNVLIYPGDGSGAFGSPATYPVQRALFSGSLVVKDVNHDGVPDIAASITGVSILLGKGDGTFFPAMFYPAATSSGNTALAHFNGDGNQDIVAFDGLTVSIYAGDRYGLFQRPKEFAAGQSPWSVAIGHFESSSKQDLVVANSASNSVSVLLGDGAGHFLPALNYAVGSSPRSVAVADFNRDGKDDLAVVNYGDGTVSVLQGEGLGKFQPPVTYHAGGATFVTAADLNGDDKLDLVVASGGAYEISIFSGNGDGTFQSPMISQFTQIPYSVSVADLNGDGRLDLAVAFYSYQLLGNFYPSTQIGVMLGKGDGTFGAPALYTAGVSPVQIAVGNLNGDGLPDLAVNGSYGGEVSILLGTGGGIFEPTVSYLIPYGAAGPGAVAGAIALGDFDGDGKLDLAMAGTYTVEVMVGQGDGTFQTGPQFEYSYGTESMAVGDFNKDGKADLAVTDYYLGTVTVLTNMSH